MAIAVSSQLPASTESGITKLVTTIEIFFKMLSPAANETRHHMVRTIVVSWSTMMKNVARTNGEKKESN